MAGKADPWADVDFDEIQEATCLEVRLDNTLNSFGRHFFPQVDDIKVLFNCFQLFDTKKQDFLLADDINEVLR